MIRPRTTRTTQTEEHSNKSPSPPAAGPKDRFAVKAACSCGSCGSWTILFHILNLLAELLDGGLEVQADRRQGRELRLRAQGVGIAHEFLGQEVQPSSNGAVARQE